MKIHGTQYFCDSKSCKATQFLEDGEDITDMNWMVIPGEGLFCEECAEGFTRDDRAAEGITDLEMVPYASSIRERLNNGEG